MSATVLDAIVTKDWGKKKKKKSTILSLSLKRKTNS